MKDLGLRTNIDVVTEFVELQGSRVIDAGCGSMVFSRQLAAAGAQVIAVDPDPIQAEKNRKISEPGIEFFETGADQLPVGDTSVDGVFFAYSLHHIPEVVYPRLFDEVVRVLKSDGYLYVIEPFGGPLNDVMILFHNEEQVRADAQTALATIASKSFSNIESFDYHSIRQFDSFEDFATQFTAKTFNTNYGKEDVWNEEVRTKFEEMGRPDYRFEAPKRGWIGRGLV